MAKIFVSHSKRDKEIRNFFSDIFSPTKVQAVFEEFEAIRAGQRTAPDILDDIEAAKAIFVLLGPQADALDHTRDWITGESGAGANKDVWVFEPYHHMGTLSTVVPWVRHHVVYTFDDPWYDYIQRLVESYDDSHVPGAVLGSAGLGAMLAEQDRAGGAIVGGIAGLILSDKSGERPSGQEIQCPKCHSVYALHCPENLPATRCPVCNSTLQLQQ